MTVDKTLGDYGARIVALEKNQTEIHDDVKAIRSTLDEAKGGWRIILFAATSAGALASLVAHKAVDVWKAP